MSLFTHWKNDFRSSLVVFLVALPLCLGIALASQAPMSAGLIAGVIGGIVVGSLSGSPVSVSGPAAGLSVIVVSSLTSLGSFELFVAALFLSGLIQIVFGFFRGGIIGDYFPSSVIRGMLAAIGLILILKQFPHAVGFDGDFMGDENFEERGGFNTFSRLFYTVSMGHQGAIFISLMCLFIILGWEYFANRGKSLFMWIPSPLVAVGAGLFLAQYFDFRPEHFVSLPPRGFEAKFYLPTMEMIFNLKVFGVALTLALVTSVESLLSVDAADRLDLEGRQADKNRELLAQGVGNTISGLLGGLPVTAVIVRTSANANAGAKSNLSTILHGVWLLLAVVSIPFVLDMIPLSALATILMIVGYRLVKPRIILDMYRKGWDQFIPFAVTIVAIMLTNLLTGIAIGMIVGFFFVIKSNIHKSVVMVSEGNLYLIRFYKDVTFLQKARLQKLFRTIPSGSQVIIDGSNSVFIDNDIADVIEDFVQRSVHHDIQVILKKSTLALCPLFKEENNG